jgi:putative ABC transport system ATP-binding protein
MALFDRLHDSGQTILVVTHEHDIAAHAHREVTLRDGIISSDVLTERGGRRHREPVPSSA